MFGIPGEVFWPTAAFMSMIVLVFGGIVVLRLLPHKKSQTLEQPDSQALEEMEQLRRRLGELEERVDFAERLLAKQREVERPALKERS